jgi:GxxExxY protein
MKINEITYAIIGASMKVHSALGPGLLEKAYEVCVAYELKKQGFEVLRQERVPITYEDVKLECGFFLDILVQNTVLVEVKAKQKLHPIDSAQLLSHLRLLKKSIGLLINFHELDLKDGIERIANNYHE